MTSYMDDMELGEVIAKRRTELNLTQAELANKLGLDKTNFISMVEKGRSKMPLAHILKMASALEFDRMWFTELVFRARFTDMPDVLDFLFENAKKGYKKSS